VTHLKPLGFFYFELSAATLERYPVLDDEGGAANERRKFKEVQLTFEFTINLWSISITYGLFGTKKEGMD
jgi:hypothetical protein